MIISGGGDYYGTLQEFDGVMVPHGMGVCKYSDYNEHGMFQNGILCGIGIVESGSRIQVGMTYNKVINGWGLIVDKSEITFGIFDDSKIQVNLSSLVRSFFLKIIDDVHQHHEKLFVIGKKKEIFIGISEVFIFKKAGFHFLGNGEVYFGVCNDGEDGRTGKFLHFGLDNKITRGEFENGELVREIDDVEFGTAFNGVYASPEYFLFDINRNFNSLLFDLKRHLFLKIVEVGQTPFNLIVKANEGKLVNKKFECNRDINQNTIWFMFPLDNQEIKKKIFEFEQRSEPWLPILSDYYIEFIGFISGGHNIIQKVYKHISCYDKSAEFDLDLYGDVDLELYYITWGGADLINEEQEVSEEDEDSFLCLIPELTTKKSIVEEICKRRYDNPCWDVYRYFIKDYLANGYDLDWDFFVWLFDNDMFKYYTSQDLPAPYYSAYESFLYLFFDGDENDEYDEE